ncbi:MAG: primosomal protein N' [Fermentimonas sp.]|nr:primosomal protein N' [Fermentimonas sp.]
MYADVILPLPFSDLYTYSVPVEMRDKITRGSRVIVPFGNRKYYTAIVYKIQETAPKGFKVKEIHSLSDSEPIVNEQQLKLWEWISYYYLSPLGDVYKTALPSSLKSEDLKSKFKPKTETFIRINPGKDAANITGIIGRAVKQKFLYNQIQDILTDNKKEHISRKEVSELAGYSVSVLNGLIKKEVLQTIEVETGRLNTGIKPIRKPHPLNDFQQKAFNEIIDCFENRQTCLLHGVTSSGKTEIYIHLIEEALSLGKQTLYLVPEIALTTQLTQRLQAVYGSKIGIYHSKINDNERAEIWNKMLSDEPYEIILGVRSSLFLPYQQLGLVIIDEEHEMSYKQQEPSPRYHARDTAIMLAHFYNAKTILGSATPSLESYFNTRNGKYGIVTLQERYRNILMPEIKIENTFELRKRKKMKSLLTPALIEQMKLILENGEQVILFRNRRGFASLIECEQCAWSPKCKRCDVTLTYHKKRNRLICHYCNASYPMPVICPSCNSENLKTLGQGTEQLEEEVERLFPDYIVGRMDLDTTRGKDAYEKIIDDFQSKRIHILIGTQMLSKGLDFENVGIVGIISSDSLLNYPDFRSHERGFQLMMQAAGRAGRKNRQGKVIIQSADPDQPVYGYISKYDYEGFFNSQMAERRMFNYPPFCRLISIILKHKTEQKVDAGSDYLAALLRQSFSDSVQGPSKPIVSFIQRYHLREILLKLDYNLSIKKTREIIKSAETRFHTNKDFKYIMIHFDVDKV